MTGTIAGQADAALVRLRSPRGRWVILATVLGSGIAALDATVVNVALPTMGGDLNLGFTGLQWTINAYTLTLASLLLLGGSLGDRFGRRRVFVIGVVWFGCASLLCALAPNGAVLISARALQGVGGALLTPGSLAIIEASFAVEDRAAAVGAWSGLAGVATAIGPLLGGWFVQAATWRLVFLINLPLAAFVVWVAVRHVPESSNPHAARRLDIAGTVLAAVGLGLLVEALTVGPGDGWPALDIAAVAGSVVAILALVVVESRTHDPMVPMDIFSSREFSATNVVTFLLYGALGGSLFLLPLELQRVAGFSPVKAGISLLPITVLLLLFSARAGRLAQRIGPRLPMTVGPLLAGVGFLLMTRVGEGSSYFTDVFPAVLVLAAGLALTVAPLTSTVLAAASDDNAGIASAINNDVARTAGLLAVAVLPIAAGISASDYARPAVFSTGFHHAMVIGAALCAAGGLVSLALVGRGRRRPAAVQVASHCAISAPPLRGRVTAEASVAAHPHDRLVEVDGAG